MNSPLPALFWLQLRRMRRTIAVFPFIAALMVLTSMVSYRDLYKTVEERTKIARTLYNDSTVMSLFGHAHNLDTASGFAAWRTLGVMSILAAIWGIAAGTRVLRGDEDKGRNEVAFTGVLSRREATAALLSALLVAAVAWSVGVFVVLLLMSNGDYGVTSAAFCALAVAMAPVTFVSVGALAGQILPSRRSAVGAGGAMFGVLYLGRMAADVTGNQWARWLSPFGWTNLAEPLSGSRWTVFVVWICVSLILAASVVFVSGRRDYGSGWVRLDSRRSSNVVGLNSTLAMSVRLRRGGLSSWFVALTMSSVLMGVLVQSEMTIGESSAQTDEVLSKLGAGGTGVNHYSGVYFLVLALVLCLAAVGFATSARDEEAEGRLDSLLALPVGRVRWFVERVLLHIVALAVLGIAGGVGIWGGITLTGSSADIPTYFGAGANLVPVAALTFAFTALLIGVAPRLTAAGGYALVGWSFVVQMVASLTPSLAWLGKTSIFHYLRLLPSQPFDGLGSTAMAFAATAAIVVATMTFRRRDLASG